MITFRGTKRYMAVMAMVTIRVTTAYVEALAWRNV